MNGRTRSTLILPTLPPLYTPSRSSHHQTTAEPPSPGSPCDYSATSHHPDPLTIINEPWILRVRNSRSPNHIPHPLSPRATPPQPLHPLVESVDEDTPTSSQSPSTPPPTTPTTPPHSPSPLFLDTPTPTSSSSMSSSGALKRKVVIMGSPSVGESLPIPDNPLLTVVRLRQNLPYSTVCCSSHLQRTIFPNHRGHLT